MDEVRMHPTRPLRFASALTAAALLLGATAPRARADDNIGVYLGGSLGAAQASYGANTFDASGANTGYKFALGVRPLSVFAAEASYINFGRSYGGINYADTYAEGLFALGFLPIPWVDVYGKLGVAEFRTDAYSPFLSFHRTGADLAYGVGAGTNWGRLGARLEYERYEVSHASDMGMASFGLTWVFL